MSRIRSFALLASTVAALAIPASASAGGACYGDACAGGAVAPSSEAPSVIVAPKGFYRQYVHQLGQVADACGYEMDNTGVWTQDQQQQYYKLVNSFNAYRDRLNRKMSRRGLGFAPSLYDWETIARFKQKDGAYTLLFCPVG